MDKKRLVPCNYCREKHLKCTDAIPCTHCSKLQKDCVRAKKRYRFSKTKRLDASLGFADDQTWVKTKNADNLSFIDVTPQRTRNRRAAGREREMADISHSEQTESNDASGADNDHEEDEDEDMDDVGIDYAVPVPESEPTQNLTIAPPSYESLARQTSRTNNANDHVEQTVVLTPALSAPSLSSLSPTAHAGNALALTRLPSHEWRQDVPVFASPHSRASHTVPVHHFATSPLDTALQNRVPSTALRGLPEGFTDEAYLQLREACLMRHFVENLSPWVSEPRHVPRILSLCEPRWYKTNPFQVKILTCFGLV